MHIDDPKFNLDGRGRPRVLLLVDRPGWAYDTAAKAIARRLGDAFEFRIEYVIHQPDLSVWQPDLVYVFFWGETWHKPFFPDPRCVIKEISSHRWAHENQYGCLSAEAMVGRYLADAGTLTATSRRLQEMVAHYRPVLWTPNGFEPSQFFDRQHRGCSLKIGWAGNASDPCKGLEDILRPAADGTFDLHEAGGKYDHGEMGAFYNQVDVFCVASTAEGEPLTLVEAMASGCFPVCTDVGIVPELVRHGDNGLIVERSPDAFRKAFEWCRDHLDQVREAGHKNAQWMARTRTWDIVCEQWRSALHQALRHRMHEPILTAPTVTADDRNECWQRNLGEKLLEWPERAMAASRLLKMLPLPKRGSVIDLGCGRQTMRSLIPSDYDYVPVDRLARSADTQVLDFNSEMPAGQYTAAVMLGLLEYLDRPLDVLRWAASHAQFCVFSYNDSPDRDRRARQHWRNRLARDEILSCLRSVGGQIHEVLDLGSGLKVYACAFAPTTSVDGKTLALLSAGVTSTNSGDSLITAAVQRLLPRHQHQLFPLLRRLTDEEIEQVNACDQAIICGTNLYQHTFACALTSDVMDRIRIPILPLGVGASAAIGHMPRMDDDGIRAVRRLHERCAMASVRDPLSWNFVRSLGISNVELTGCPVLFHGGVNPSFHPRSGGQLHLSIRARLLHVEDTWLEKQRRTLDLICEEFHPVLVLQSPYDVPIAEELAHRHGLSIEWQTDNAATPLLRGVRNASRVIGYRLHFGMLALSHGIPSTFIGSDTRVSEFCGMMGLPYHDVRTYKDEDVLSELRQPAPSYDRFLNNRSSLRSAMDGVLADNGLTAREHPATRPPSEITLDTRKPRILLMADVPNWIFERHCLALNALLDDEFDFVLGFQGEKFNEDAFDLIYALDWNLIPIEQIQTPAKYVTGIRAHFNWADLDFPSFTTMLATKFNRVHVVSERLRRIFQPVLPGIVNIPHGLDTKFFMPRSCADLSGHGRLRLGWAGNRKSPAKGYAEFIEPLGQLPGVELVVCGYSDRNLTHEEMRGWYDAIDAYICASLSEGHNNPLMEAGAMARAIITTDNGTVPEYLRDGESALIVPRTASALREAVERLRDDHSLRVRLGESARASVLAKWDWQVCGKAYREFFQAALRSATSSPAVPPGTIKGDHMPLVKTAVSFCIITNGKQPHKLRRELDSIRALQLNQYEIVIAGEVPADFDANDVTIVPMPNAARNGRLGEMRNRLVEQARFPVVVVADDDMVFAPDFGDGLAGLAPDFEVCCARIRNPDGTRFWDWATHGGPRGHVLLDEAETDPHVYVTGGLCIAKKTVFDRVKWDESLGFYQSEDLDFSSKLRAAGMSIRLAPGCQVTHDDPRYTQVGQVVVREDEWLVHAQDRMSDGQHESARALLHKLIQRQPDNSDAACLLQVLDKQATPAAVKLPVRWCGPVFNPSGYASEAINFLLPLATRLNLGLFHHNNLYSEKFVNGLPERERAQLFALRDRFTELSAGIVISHNPANGLMRLPDAQYAIGRTMFETDRIPKDWITACNQMDEIWVPSQFNVETFAAAGVERDKLVVMPEAVDSAEFDPARHEPLPLPNRAGFNFLAIFEWSSRKAWDVLIAAYLREFSASDDVCLYLRTYLFSQPDGDPKDAIWQMIREHAASLGLGDKPWPRIEVLAEQVPLAELPRLYKAADCLVAPSRGEGWGRPHHEAMLMELPVIATNWSGNTEFMNNDVAYMLDFEMQDIKHVEPELWHYRGHRWANPSESHLRHTMRHILQHPDEARAKGKAARAHMVANYSRDRVADLVVQRLAVIEQKLSTANLPSCRSVAAVAIGSGNQPVRIAWEGAADNAGSLGHVNREIVRQLVRQPKVTVKPDRPDVTVRHQWPPAWTKPKSGLWVLMQPWEFGHVPSEWVQNIVNVDEVWTPSEYSRRTFIDSGVSPSKVKVVPNGIDPDRFKPDAAPRELATRKTFKFLFVGGTIHRKGADVLLRAYLDTFSASDDVCLVIKDVGGNSFYAGQTMADEIRAAQSRPNAPEILYLTDDLKTDEIPGLYTACDCLVHPYRGEGFGLPVLEAMACGLPAIVTGGGATDDFVDDQTGYRLAARRKQLGWRVGHLPLNGPGWLLEPEEISLAATLQWVHTHRDEARSKGRAASERVRRDWTWERAARVAADRARDLVSRQQADDKAVRHRRASKSDGITLPAVARLGQLNGKHDPVSVRAALDVRPFNPDALKCRALPGHAEPRLTVCLIVKNEERFIGQCLDSVRDIAWQIVVADTGSTDRTKQIAIDHGAEVHEIAWTDDFSAARNAALEHARGDWVLMLDADEELTAQGRLALAEEMRQTKVMAYRLPIVDAGKEDEGCSYVPRLFRNAPGLFYVGRIHEQIFSSIEVLRKKWGLDNRLSKATLLHHGYTAEMTRSRRKNARNLLLLQKALEEFPNEPNLLMNFGLELVRAGRLADGLDQYLEAFHLMSAQPTGEVPPELREALLTQLCAHLMTGKRFDLILDVLDSKLARSHGLTASMHFARGLAHMELKQFPKAVDEFRRCIAKRDEPVLCPINRDVRGAGPHHCLAIALFKLQKHDEAGAAFEAAIMVEPTSRKARFDYAVFLAERGFAVDALKMLHRLVTEKADEVAVWLLGGQIALSQPEFVSFADDWTREAIKIFPEDKVLQAQRAVVLTWQALRTGDALPSVGTAIESKASSEFMKLYRRALAQGDATVTRAVTTRLPELSAVMPAAGKVLTLAVAAAR
jgi:glycosyltransferase involved in cell wall biosynthesis/tetratricopeptide (TPR) repeat protein